jgi:hypothetical protein
MCLLIVFAIDLTTGVACNLRRLHYHSKNLLNDLMSDAHDVKQQSQARSLCPVRRRR